MKPVRYLALGVALWLVSAAPASAAWDNVFQTCCFRCKSRPVTSYYVPASPICCQPQVSYVQRCYYQPVTTYRQVTYYQPVQQQYTSYYYEPVTTYRYSTYYDPCTGCPHQMACPQTCYQLRSRCNTVTRYMARCTMVPETRYRQVTYYQAVPSCPQPCNSCGSNVMPPAGVSSGEPPMAPGAVQPPAGVSDGSSNGTLPPQNLPYGSSFRQSQPGPSAPAPVWPTQQPTRQPTNLRMDRIASAPVGGVTLTGQVLQRDFSPRAGVRVVFVSHRQPSRRQSATSDTAGLFHLTLAPGDWDVYLSGPNGQPTYHNHYALANRPANPLTILSR